ncbi:MAG: hypothetical protein VR74_13605 [Hyphomonas sp. BRH_c22]|uniref:UbiA family prenyltransferase n=1 Tax=Hyphomonas sp. BRH_c22 TaxID=1629710 RepID=UPI0005F0E924|nr:UbiA family prenyltransferase [Hyphomonas sp. BRH_c22]KJS36272.1 MAG: hypothetical protein VR74_13605 [Hyphomonas sp. BRH_c22]
MLGVIMQQASEESLDVMSEKLPLVLDLDGTLLRTDLLVEGIVNAFFRRPMSLFAAMPLALVSRARFKQRIAAISSLDIDSLPVNEQVLDFAETERNAGRDIHLFTAATQSVADKVAARFGIFSSVVGSTPTLNLKSARKRDALVERFPDGYIYAGDARADLPVWQAAKAAVLVDVPASVAQAVRADDKPVFATFSTPTNHLKSWRKALRLHQWVKNLLVFVPLLLSHEYLNPPVVLSYLTVFLILSVSASGTYILNDLADLSDDRRHKTKRNRPFAAGELNPLMGLCVSLVVILGGLIASGFVSTGFFLALFAYLALTLSYSFGLKRIPVLDVVILAILFTLRLVMGTEAGGAGYSEWLLTFSMFFFLSLSLAKRFVEVSAKAAMPMEIISGRGYRGGDYAFISALGVASGVASILILVLFLREDAFKVDIYQIEAFLWGIPVFMTLFLGRIWLLASRGELNEDPVAFAVKDKVSYLLGIGLVFCMLAAVLIPG